MEVEITEGFGEERGRRFGEEGAEAESGGGERGGGVREGG